MTRLSLLVVAWLVVSPARAEDARLLMLGNSYTQQNELDQRVAPALADAVPAWSDVFALRLANGGWNLADHAAEADGSHGDTLWRQALVTGPDAGSWDWVFLQDQSQIPGFPQTEASWQESRDGAVILAGLIADGGGEAVFLLTWGRRDGDATNAWLFPDYSTMQALLLDGYLAYAEAVGSAGYEAWIAPAGLAFRQVHDDLVAAGEDPVAEGSAFHALYSGDGSHPSPQGSYLAALAASAGLTGRSVSSVSYPGDVDAATAELLQDAADRAVLGDPFGAVPYRWAHEWADWTDPAGVQTAGRAVSDTVTHPLVRVTADAEAAGGLALGAEHGERGVGDGRVRVDAGTLHVTGPLEIGAVGSGELDVRGGQVVADEVSLGAGGTLSFVVDETLDDRLTVLGAVDLDGALVVTLHDGANMGPSGHMNLIAAATLTNDLSSTSVPDGFDLEFEDEQAVEGPRLLLVWGENPGDDDSAEGDDDTSPGDDDTSEAVGDDDSTLEDGPSGCSCGLAGTAGFAGVALTALMLWFVGMRLVRR